MITTRVEKHCISKNHEYYPMLDDYCFKSKNLYNFANYHIRKKFFTDKEFISYNKMDKLMKQESMDFDYRNMPSAQSAQQCLRVLEKNWKAFFASIKDWGRNKDKYKGMPNPPKFLDKTNGRNVLTLTNLNCNLKENGFIKFPKTFKGFTIKTKADNVQQVRVISRKSHIVIEVVYRVNVPELLEDNGKYLGIDIGIDNLATVTNNFGKDPIIVNGKHIKSINQYYNKKFAKYKSIAKTMNGKDWSKRLEKLTVKRNRKVEDSLHKASKGIIEYAQSCGANTIIVGNNKDWKRESKLSKKINQHFIGIPHQRFIEMLTYKGENVGIRVILTEESYTSGTSFLDGESPTRENYDKTRRVSRGLFISNSGKRINADVNGSLQIIKKVIPDVFSEGIEGIGLYPIRVTK